MWEVWREKGQRKVEVTEAPPRVLLLVVGGRWRRQEVHSRSGGPGKGQVPLGCPGHFSKPTNSPIVHMQGDLVVPCCGQGAYKVSQGGLLKHVLLMGVAVRVPGKTLLSPVPCTGSHSCPHHWAACRLPCAGCGHSLGPPV